jgi:hypothetical protein
MISPELAEKLTAVVPKYVPPSPPSAKPRLPDAEESEHPRNAIIRLPRYLVREPKLPVIKERDMLTATGQRDLALRRHPGLRFGSFGGLNNDFWAHALLEEEYGIERQKEMWDLLSLLGRNGPPPVFTGRPPFATPVPASGPWKGLVVPWERR